MDDFDDLLGLEDQFYDEGYQLGVSDGAKAGKIEGRVFGLEKGFEKYIESGKLHGRSLVWAGRQAQTSNTSVVDSQDSAVVGVPSRSPLSLPPLSANPRLEKHVRVLYALTEPVSLSTHNSEEAVSDFDDRLKRAAGKVKIIEKLAGEETPGTSSDSPGRAGAKGDVGIEDVDIMKARH